MKQVDEQANQAETGQTKRIKWGILIPVILWIALYPIALVLALTGTEAGRQWALALIVLAAFIAVIAWGIRVMINITRPKEGESEGQETEEP